MIKPYPMTLPQTVSDRAVEALETSVAAYLGYSETIALDSLDNAFSLVLSTLQERSAVLCSPNAPLALFNALKEHNLQAAYCDLRLDGTMETRFFQKSATPQTKALLLSHNHGILSDGKTASGFAEEHGITLIEDATQAFGKKEKTGAKLTLYSLETLVPATVARGAFIATDDKALAASLRQKALGGYVQKKFWNYDVVNTDATCTLSPLTAQMALDAMDTIDEKEQHVKEIQNAYLQTLSSNRLIELPKRTDLVADPCFPLALVPALFCPKEDIFKALVDAGIPVKVGNKPVYKTTAYKDDTLSLFGAEEVFKAQLLLPAYWWMSLDDVNAVTATFQNVLERYGYRGCSF